MLPRLGKTLDAYDRERSALLDELQSLDTEQLEKKPLPEKWSLLEIAEHLVLAEREILQGLPDPSELVDRKRSLKNRMGYPLVMAVLRFRIPVKVPSRGMVPRGETTIPELRRQWDESQSWLRSYVESLGPDELGRGVFRHPVTGPLTVPQTLRMGRAHLRTHLRQIRRLQQLM
jgi:hypothetical protein